MQHGQLVPSLYAEELNPHIDFDNTPFVVQQKLAPWERPVISINGKTQIFPRIAGISSFGAGGSNAHIVVEEYIPGTNKVLDGTSKNHPVIIVLSARNQKDLKNRVKRLLQFIDDISLHDSDMLNLAYTLQVGREAMRERLALITNSIIDLKSKLTSYIEGITRKEMKNWPS